MPKLKPGSDKCPGRLPAAVTLHTVVHTGRRACHWKRHDETFVKGSSCVTGAARRARRLPSGGPTAQRRVTTPCG
ncbi:hypothetical protein ACLOJK_024298 [Asimina triloba]